jgi:hypothetical protein
MCRSEYPANTSNLGACCETPTTVQRNTTENTTSVFIHITPDTIFFVSKHVRGWGEEAEFYRRSQVPTIFDFGISLIGIVKGAP